MVLPRLVMLPLLLTVATGALDKACSDQAPCENVPATEAMQDSALLQIHSSPAKLASIEASWEEDTWVPLPQANDTFFDKVIKLFAARPRKEKCCLESEAEVLSVGANIKPLNQTYDPSHPHYNSFWLVAHSLLKLVKSEGLLLEFGVAQGSSATLSGGIIQQSQHPERIFYGFDVFTGLPEAWGNFKKGAFNNPNGKLPAVPQNVHLVKGLFKDTLPPFLSEHPGPAAFINVDCDLYTGALDVLRGLTSRMVPGTIIHFHEITMKGSQELKALQEWLQHDGKDVELELLNIDAFVPAQLRAKMKARATA